MHKNIFLMFFAFCLVGNTYAQKDGHYDNNKFKQLEHKFPTPNMYRNAAGAPGSKYYQQRADYQMDIELDDKNEKLYGKQTVTYYNNSPDNLEYLWVQLDQNVRSKKNSLSDKIKTTSISKYMSPWHYGRNYAEKFDGGFNIDYVTQKNGRSLKYTIVNTMMRIDLPEPLEPGDKFSFKIKWWYNINNYIKYGGRSGFEPFYENGQKNNLYVIAQFFPRMAVYNDVEGWQNLQFFGRSEFALVFGNYDVNITVPADHIVGATGKLQNESEVLTSTERKRLKQAKKSFDKPVIIVTQEEAKEKENKFSDKKKTWEFSAKNVRDFGFSTSRKFIWDAMAVKIGRKSVMAMSLYPKEGNPLWEQLSTRAVAHTLKVYSKYTFDYPYHKAISVHARSQGMEYPMICWNYGRPEKDGTYSERTKYGMLGVIIHEIGHNFFPMIVNSDERKWGWMDEGLNTFLQSVTESEWSDHFPTRRGPASKIIPYMKGDQSNLTPIMTHSDNVRQYGPNCYSKPATALTILRETILGRELFDYAFKKYAQRWKFKHPTPYDFFRTMEDASGVDLDWFWRGWFYTTNYCDISLEKITQFNVNTQNPKIEKAWKKKQNKKERNKVRMNNKKYGIVHYLKQDSAAIDFYDKYDRYAVTDLDKREYQHILNSVSEDVKKTFEDKRYFYELQFGKPGGLVMPIILEFTFEDGTTKRETLHAKIWRFNDTKVTKVFTFDKKLKAVTIDPDLETADVDTSNNHWPARVVESRFDTFRKKRSGMNPMQRSQ